jgi:hypothetical protein
MSDRVRAALMILILAATLSATVFWSYAAWAECRSLHPWWYCLRILG